MPAYFIFFVDINIDKFILIKLLQAENYSCSSNGEQAEELRLFFSEGFIGLQSPVGDAECSFKPLCIEVKLY